MSTPEAEPPKVLTVNGVDRHFGWTVGKTFSSYVANGYAPPPNAMIDGVLKGYTVDYIEEWARNRAGRGRRTDLDPNRPAPVKVSQGGYKALEVLREGPATTDELFKRTGIREATINRLTADGLTERDGGTVTITDNGRAVLDRRRGSYDKRQTSM